MASQETAKLPGRSTKITGTGRGDDLRLSQNTQNERSETSHVPNIISPLSFDITRTFNLPMDSFPVSTKAQAINSRNFMPAKSNPSRMQMDQWQK